MATTKTTPKKSFYMVGFTYFYADPTTNSEKYYVYGDEKSAKKLCLKKLKGMESWLKEQVDKDFNSGRRCKVFCHELNVITV